MKRVYLVIVTLLVGCNFMFGQLSQDYLNNSFGQIRADMVKFACKIADYKIDTTLAKIQNKNIFAFYNDLESQGAKEKKIATLKTVVGNANSGITFNGTNINVYKTRITKFKDELIKGLLSNYDKKKEDINKGDADFAGKINKLVEDCQEKEKKLAEEKAEKDKQKADSIEAERKTKEAKAEADKKAAEEKAAKEEAARQKAAADKAAKEKAAADKKIEEEYKAEQARIAALEADAVEKAKLLKEAEKQKAAALEAQKAEYVAQLKAIAEGQDKLINTIITIVVAVLFIALIICFLVIYRNKKKKNSDVMQQTSNQTQQPQQTHPQSMPQPTTIPTQPKVAFAADKDEWIVVGASVVGNGHISTKLPCQDSHKYEYLGEGWGIAVTSDGAGSAQNSHIGSKIVAERSVFHFKDLITRRNWIKKNELPTETEWSQICFATLKLVRNDMEMFAKQKNIELKSLYATAIVVIHTPDGILATHIGDGRAGYKNQQGEWKALITPHKGEEANQTIFVPSEFWDIPAYKMSGVLVPESVVVAENPFAFTLMSDGCESTAWLYNQQDETTGKFFDPNKPFPNFFNPLSDTLQSFRNDKVDEKERAAKWGNFIESGNPSFKKEQDDKTMILGVVYM